MSDPGASSADHHGKHPSVQASPLPQYKRQIIYPVRTSSREPEYQTIQLDVWLGRMLARDGFRLEMNRV